MNHLQLLRVCLFESPEGVVSGRSKKNVEPLLIITATFIRYQFCDFSWGVWEIKNLGKTVCRLLSFDHVGGFVGARPYL